MLFILPVLAILTLVAAEEPTKELNHPEFDFDLGDHETVSLTPEQRKKGEATLKRIMAQLDTDKDGKLSADELKKHVSNSVKDRMQGDDARVLEQARETLKKDLALKDSNKDGFVSKTEVFKEFSVEDFSTNEFLRHQDDTFDLADRNKDGKLNATEFLEFLHPHLGSMKEDYKRMISKDAHDDADGDKDGHITWDEHWNKATEGHNFQDDEAQFEELKATEKKLFDEHDRDGNGQLTYEEHHDMLFPDINTMDLSGPQAKNMHSLVDHNNDGQLSWDEMTKDNSLHVLVSGLEETLRTEL